MGNVYSKKFLKLVPEAVRVIKAYRKKHPFDAIAFTGSSGAALAFPLSYLLKVPLIHVRKKDRNHYGRAIEGTISSKKYIIVDDFISSGATLKRILSTVKKELPTKPTPVGIFLYAAYGTQKEYQNVPVWKILLPEPKR